MKAFTDLEQSKKLAEFLPLETADMYYWCGEDLRIGSHKAMDLDYDIPCWSLAALMDVYPMVVGRDMDMYCCWQNHKNLHSRHYDNPVDACVAMIEKLHEQKLL